MTNQTQVDKAARAAIARAKARRSESVTADDLLLGLLGEMSRLGIAWIGEWPIDIASLSAGSGDCGNGAAAPDYAPEAVRVFERGAAIAREDGARSVGVIHLLAAFATEDSPVMRNLRLRYGFDSAGWRAALARTAADLEQRSTTIADDNGSGAGRVAELLSVDDAASVLSVHAQTIRNYIRSGKLPAYRLAGERAIRVLRKDLLALLEQVRIDETEEPAATT